MLSFREMENSLAREDGMVPEKELLLRVRVMRDVRLPSM